MILIMHLYVMVLDKLIDATTRVVLEEDINTVDTVHSNKIYHIAFTWLKYCGYGVKFYPIVLFEVFNQCTYHILRSF